MSALAAFLVPPLLASLSYRRAGVGWGRVSFLTAVAVVLSLVGGLVAVFYAFVVTVGAEQCGSTPVVAAVAGIVAYLVVAAWAARRPRNVWAWAAAPLAGLALVLLVGYFFAGAHAYCET